MFFCSKNRKNFNAKCKSLGLVPQQVLDKFYSQFSDELNEPSSALHTWVIINYPQVYEAISPANINIKHPHIKEHIFRLGHIFSNLLEQVIKQALLDKAYEVTVERLIVFLLTNYESDFMLDVPEKEKLHQGLSERISREPKGDSIPKLSDELMVMVSNLYDEFIKTERLEIVEIENIIGFLRNSPYVKRYI